MHGDRGASIGAGTSRALRNVKARRLLYQRHGRTVRSPFENRDTRGPVSTPLAEVARCCTSLGRLASGARPFSTTKTSYSSTYKQAYAYQ